MRQLIHIHGGKSFDTYEEYWQYLVENEIYDPHEPPPVKWRDRYEEFLGDDWFIVRPQMPSPRNAKYKEWKVWFEKYIPFFTDEVVLIGHSLGANFLAKYLAECTLPVSIFQLHLVAGCFGSPGGFDMPSDLSNVESQCKEIYIYHSQDDPVVPFSHASQYKQALPQAELVVFEDRGHFLGEEFPELIERIRS